MPYNGRDPTIVILLLRKKPRLFRIEKTPVQKEYQLLSCSATAPAFTGCLHPDGPAGLCFLRDPGFWRIPRHYVGACIRLYFLAYVWWGQGIFWRGFQLF